MLYCYTLFTLLYFTLSAAWEIPNLFSQSEPAQISSINRSCLTVWKTSHNHCIFWVTGVLWFCIVCSCFNVLMSHVQSSIELLYSINYCCCKLTLPDIPSDEAVPTVGDSRGPRQLARLARHQAGSSHRPTLVLGCFSPPTRATPLLLLCIRSVILY